MAAAAPLLAVVLVSLALVSDADAQSVAGSYADLRPLLKEGLKVVVTDLQGRTTVGRVTDVNSDSFVLDTGIGRSAAFGDGLLSARWRADSVRNGLLIGLGTGAVIGGLSLAPWCNYPADCTDYGGKGGMFAYGALIGGGIGAGVGALIDRLHTRRELVVEYRWLPGRTQALRVVPRIDRRRVGLAAALRF